MALNLALHHGVDSQVEPKALRHTADSKIEEFLDRDAPDDWMRSRFMEWEFLDNIIN